jgi:phenylacetate-coenzyme A ligase PaaK-like adenylate-forming protein
MERSVKHRVAPNICRALDLILDVVEHTGASALPAGHLATPGELMTICKNFKPTILSGDTSQLLRFASYVESTGSHGNLKINKIFYTSEPMSRLQRSYLESVFSHDGTPPGFTSAFASAEMGIWAVSNFALTGPQLDDSSDFIFDSRHMIVEVLPLEVDISSENCNFPCTLEYRKKGQLVVTSLQRLRNPLVRYLTGDIGSVHELPESTSSLIPGDSGHLRVLRLCGRDLRSSFKWQGEYFEFSGLQRAMANPSWGILRWQVVLGKVSDEPNFDSLEVRIMRETRKDAVELLVSQEVLVHELKEYFCVRSIAEPLFHVTLTAPDEFVRSTTGNKVIMFVDRRYSR